MNPSTYRSYLQAQANAGDQGALALLQVVGDDGRVDDTFQRSGVNIGAGGRQYSKDEVNSLNQRFGQSYTGANGQVQGAYNEPAGGAGNSTAGDRAYLDDQEQSLRSLLGKSSTYLNQGLSGITDSYNKETGRQQDAQAQALRGYDQKRTETTQSKLGALNKVDTNARTLADSLRRILGLAGAANSSAARVAAPGAVARQATEQRGGVIDQYGSNLRNIDQAQGDTELSFKNIMQDLLEQRNQKELGLRQGIGQQEIQSQQSLADIARQRSLLNGGGYGDVRAATAPFRAQVDQGNNALDQLFNQFRTPYAQRSAQVATPQLADYTVDRAAINANAQGGAAEGSPYSQFLRKRLQGQS